MTAASVAMPRAFAVQWKDFNYWQVRSLRLSLTNHCNWPTAPLGKLAKVRSEIIPGKQVQEDYVNLLDRISFDEGKVFSGKRISTRMITFRAAPGDIVVSKINAGKRAIGIVPQGKDIGITIHFRSLIPDLTQVNTEFLWMALRSSFCVQQFEVETGGIGKGEISEEKLLNIAVPFPSLPEQKAIVAHWHRSRRSIEDGYAQLRRVIEELNEKLWECYRKETSVDVLAQRSFPVDWRYMREWDVKSARAVAYKLACPNFAPLSSFAEEATELVPVWKEPEKKWAVFGVNNKEGVFLNSYQKGEEFNSSYKRIEKGWFFHNPTRANVGSLGVVPEVPENAVTSPEYQVWRIFDDTPIGYVATLINTEFFLRLVDIHRVGAVKQRLYVENLLQITIPPQSAEFMEEIAIKREKALSAIKAAKQKEETVNKEVEAMILGTGPVNGGKASAV